ncbi:MAG: hypothetical protein HY904_22165 [Deltaproteobacteria bacterium]|nr:hypothetical protein [Deltaproteobacteria bacterium]
MAKSVRVAAAVGALLTGLACDPATAESVCGDRACSAGERCVAANCRVTCGPGSACPDGFTCEVDICMPAGQGGLSSSGGFVVVPGATSRPEGAASSTATAPGSSSAVFASSSATHPVTSSAPSSIAAASSSSSLAAASSSSAPSSSAQGCAAQARPCFTGVDTGSGCRFDYRCTARGQVCVAPDNTCVNYAVSQTPNQLHAGECDRVIVGQKVYVICNIPGGWYTSHSHCAELPGFGLGSITTAEEQAALAQWIWGGDFWMGLTNRQDANPPLVPAAPSPDGRWVWLDGSAYDATSFGWNTAAAPWCNGEPNNPNSEHCVMFRANGDCWDDHACTTANPFICARE